MGMQIDHVFTPKKYKKGQRYRGTKAQSRKGNLPYAFVPEMKKLRRSAGP
jgi:hypothetical protein